jgi:hypothetical protein
MQKIFVYLQKDKSIYLIALLLVIIDRFLLLLNFNFNYVGSDDMIFWQGATDYMKGIFHEPYFYGQNYNFMLESVIAIPFLLVKIPYNYAFPIATSLASLFPFFLFSTILFKKGFIGESLFFVLIPLLLPIEYGILTSITRGFVSGLFFTGFLIFPLLNPSKKSSWLIAAFIVAMSYIFNPNSLVFSLPVCIYLFLVNYRRFSFYWISFIAAIPILLIEFFAKRFYILHAVYDVHVMWNLSFSFKTLLEDFHHLEKFYSYFTPFFWSMGWLIVFLIFLFGIILLRKDWKKGVSVILGSMFIIVLLGVNKVNDNIDTIFLSSTRMFLGIPLFMGLIFVWSRYMLKLSDRQLKYGLLILAISTFCIKTSLFPLVIRNHATKTNYGPIAIKKTDDLACDCSNISQLANTHKINLIIFVPNWPLNVPDIEFYNYGCPLLEKNFPQTIMNVYERRTWVYIKEGTSVEKNVMIYGYAADTANTKTLGSSEIISLGNITIIKGNKLNTESLLKQLKIDLRRN